MAWQRPLVLPPRHRLLRCSCPALTIRWQSATAKGRAPAVDDGEGGWTSSAEWEAELRRRQRVAKERGRKGPTFVDKVQVKVRAGRGGDGGVAFHREKFVEHGGPSGGNGGSGGSIYFRPNPSLRTLSSIDRRISARPGESGRGNWQNGKAGEDVVVDVPVGTVMKEVRMDVGEVDEWLDGEKPPRAKDLEDDDQDRVRERRAKVFIHYPDAEGENQSDPAMQALELDLLRRRWQAFNEARSRPAIDHDFAVSFVESPDESSDVGSVLVAKGGSGGIGNAAFTGNNRRLPRFATRGQTGEELVLDLELKTLADVGLVGFPNSGKSTLIRTLTNSRAEVASYAFTTLHPQVGTLIIYSDGSFDAASLTSAIDEDAVVEPYFTGDRDVDTARSRRPTSSHGGVAESMRLTIADCPGLLPDASLNVGLGHSFLRHIERSSILVIVVDLTSGLPPSSSPSSDDMVDEDPTRPCRDVRTLLDELEAYRPGLSGRVALIVANKADLCASGPMRTFAKQRLQRLEEFADQVVQVQEEQGARDGRQGGIIEVVPTSAKHRQNVAKVVALLHARAKCQ